MLLRVLETLQENWPKALNGVLLAFHTARPKSTVVSPFELMYARKPVLPLHLLNENESGIPENTPVNLDMEKGVPDSDALHREKNRVPDLGFYPIDLGICSIKCIHCCLRPFEYV